MREWVRLPTLLGVVFWFAGLVGGCNQDQPTVMSDMITLPRAAYEELITAERVDFIALDLQTGRKLILEGSRIYERHAPWSTFKIPNTLIGLETSDCLDPEQVMARDEERWPAAEFWPSSWHGEHDLDSAFRNSVVWYYRQLAQCVGGARYQSVLADWNYGNAQLDAGDDAFWLGAGLQIAPWEQVRFLQDLHTGMIEVADTALQRLDTISLDEVFATSGLRGKTGAGSTQDGAWEGWYVGYVDAGSGPGVVFALYASSDDYADIRDFRRAFAVELLTDAGYLPN